MLDMKRREFITLVGGGGLLLAAKVRRARAQQPAMPVIGFLRDTSLADAAHLVTAFRQGLKEAGFVEGQNVAIEYRSAEDQADRLPGLVGDLVRQQVALIVGNSPSAFAAKAVTTTVPIVFVTGGDPVIDGLVASLSRPGANTTGVSFLTGVLGAKRLELLRLLVPKASTIAVLVSRAKALGVELVALEARSPDDLHAAFQSFTRDRTNIVFALTDAMFLSERKRIALLAIAARLPTMFGNRENVEDGGLMSYGIDLRASWRRVAAFVDKILKGAKPGDVPLEFPTKLELVINLTAAKVLGLTVPPSLLARADEVIE